MKTIYVLAFALILPICSKGQKKKTRVEIAEEKLIGSWKFDYALYPQILFQKEVGSKSETFHTDTIRFYKDHTFVFRSHSNPTDDVRRHSGNWEIKFSGKSLILKNIITQPIYVRGYEGTPQDVQLNRPNNTPVFFNKIISN